MSKLSQDYEHLIRLLMVIIIAVIGFVIMRFFFVPKDFYRQGHYRGGSIAENMGRPPHYAGSAACPACHEERVTAWSKGRHRTVNCETCHGALQRHTEDPTTVKPNKPRGGKFCLLCHAATVTKPKTFPQIRSTRHNPGQICRECHNPHDPEIK